MKYQVMGAVPNGPNERVREFEARNDVAAILKFSELDSELYGRTHWRLLENRPDGSARIVLMFFPVMYPTTAPEPGPAV